MTRAILNRTDVGSPSTTGTTRYRFETPLALLAIASLAWLAQFHHFRDFGLYEDDYWFISQAMGKDWTYLWARFVKVFTTLPQGRPFGFFLPDLLSFIGDKLGGLAGIYLVGFVVVTLNTFLCYRLLRTRVPLAPAAAGAAVFCLFPADTTKILLTHDFQLQPSLTFALLSALAYTAGRRPLAYVIASGALLSYENGYLALFALPLFTAPRWDRCMLRALLKHVLILLAIVVGAVVLRYLVGESRATSSVGGITAILPPFLGSLVLGPLRSLAGMLYGPLKAVPGWDVETIAAAILVFLAFGAFLWWAPRPPRRLPEALRIAGAGAVMLVIAYALAFTHFPPNALVGRGTSVHLGATLGMSVLAAGLTWMLLSVRPRLGAALVAAYLALAVGYYVTIQRDFMRSWQLQREFWQQVAACCSDLQDGTVLLYTLTSAEEPTFIFTNSWADPLILGETYSFPSAWKTPPRLFSLTEWQSRVRQDGDHLDWSVPAATWDEYVDVLPQNNVILLFRDANGNLQRATGTVDVAGGVLTLKPPAPAQTWPPAQLHNPLLES
jgi:hypothetical protein